ncbi:MAG: glycosyltransferase family 4 protein [Solirubrobacterales bacterium]
MAAVIRGLLESPLAQAYEMEAIVTYRGARPLARVATFARSLAALTAWSRRGGPRLAHVHSAARGSLYRKGLVVALARALRVPVVFHVHAGSVDIEEFDARIGRFRRWAIGRALQVSTRVLAVSAKTATAIEACFGRRGIGVVPNSAPPLPPQARPLDPGGEAENRVLYLGGFANPVKGGEPLLEALSRVAAEHPDTSFALAGPGDPPPRLLELIGAAGNVEWLGWLDPAAKADELARSAIFVLPSLSEGLPVALLEAMTWGRAIVATGVGGVPDVVADGSDAIIVPPADVAALAVAIEALAADPGRRGALGAAARERAAALNEVEVCGRLDAIYREVLA